MFKTSIVIVDNEQEELDQLNQAFALSGLPCLPIKYEKSPTNISGIDHITSLNPSQLRIIAIDLNLDELGGSLEAKNIYSSIEGVLKRIMPKGPYFLLFWTKHSELTDEVIDLLRERSRELVQPIQYGNFDKSELKNDICNIKKKIIEEVKKVSIFESLLLWENRISNASALTISELYSLATKEQTTPWNFTEVSSSLTNIMTHIAHESVGIKNVADNPNFAIESGLLPIIEDRLLRIDNAEEDSLNSFWKSSLPQLGLRDLDKLQDSSKANLNSMYLIDSLSTNNKDNRGVFVSIPNDQLSEKDKYSAFLGIENLKTIITDEFLFNSKGGDRKFRQEARDNIILGWLEIGASCDHAQKKNKLHRYILSALIPIEYINLCEKDNKLKAHGGIFRTSTFNYNEKEYIFMSSYRYTVGAHKNSEFLGDVLFRVKDQLLADIAFQWSKYSIRPGITSFN